MTSRGAMDAGTGSPPEMADGHRPSDPSAAAAGDRPEVPAGEPTVAPSAGPPDQADVVVIGAGIVGLATALRLLERDPKLRVAVLERERRVAAHQTGHNSGVVHAGLYYAPGSAKALLCREGKRRLEAYCEKRAIPIEHPGKLVVALHESELPRLAALRERGAANGVDGLEEIGAERMREIEPHVAGIRALWSPRTGIVDFARVAVEYADDVRARGGSITLSCPVTGIRRRSGGMVASVPGGEIRAAMVVACAGLWADRVAAMSGDQTSDAPRIVPFRGDYYRLAPAAADLVRGLIYPLPDPRFPFLGVHLTRRIDGEVWAGPNAVLAFRRDGYRRRDVSLRDLASTLAYPGFLRLAGRYWRMGAAEMWRDASRAAFARELQRYLPELRADQLTFGPSGVRAQALARDGTLLDDFDLAARPGVLHVRNAPSPAATSSLAIGERLASRVLEALGRASSRSSTVTSDPG
jgi:L-2-hydroxyglutarate oxidase